MEACLTLPLCPDAQVLSLPLGRCSASFAPLPQPYWGPLTSIFCTSSCADLKSGRYLPRSQALQSVRMEARNLSFVASS